LKVALSPTSYEGAKLNSSEIEGWDFAKAKKQAESLWDKQLAKIDITESNQDKTILYRIVSYHGAAQYCRDVDTEEEIIKFTREL
jgi:putative alpha-1,2-mannosidase